jgi:hypothetical protein
MSHLSNARAFLAPCAFLVAVTAAPSANAANPCDALYNAGIKSVQTPHRVYSTRAMPGRKTQASEAVFAAGNEYLQIDGKWIRSPMPQPAMVAAAQEKLKTHPDTCTPMGDQMVGGQAVSVFKAHSNEMETDQTVRIFKSSGLLQGATMGLPNAGMEIRYEYDNVQAPPGVK